MSADSHTYVYEVDGHTIEVTRRHVGTAYARNGNVGNPTEYFTWDVKLDGTLHAAQPTRWEAYDSAVCRFDGRPIPPRRRDSTGAWAKDWMRNFRVVQAEMRRNLIRIEKGGSR
jgi:hypothetical protein